MLGHNHKITRGYGVAVLYMVLYSIIHSVIFQVVLQIYLVHSIIHDIILGSEKMNRTKMRQDMSPVGRLCAKTLTGHVFFGDLVVDFDVKASCNRYGAKRADV